MTKYVEKKQGKFFPSKEMKKIAFVSDTGIYKEAEKNPVKFWENLAEQGISWKKKWRKAYEEKPPYFKWFLGGKLNFCVNCLDRHIKNGNGKKTAIIFVPEPIDEKPVRLSYQELYDKVNRFANVLKKNGVKKGDVVSVYLPMIPEAFIAMLACTRIGAIHSVVFSAFSADALKARIEDGKARILVTADGYYRRGEKEKLLEKAEEAAKETTIKKIIVVRRLGETLKKEHLDFNKEIKKAKSWCEPEIVESNTSLYILYTSGTTGKPKGIVHDTGGYATQAYWTCKWNFNLHENDLMWCVPPTTPIITNFGTKDISAIKQNEYVLSINGKFTKVLEIFNRPYQGDIIKIKLNYFGEPILITPNHKIWASKNKKGPFEWIPASEIKKKYYLLFPKVRGARGYKRRIRISDIINYKKWKYKINEGKIFSSKGKHKISNKIKINENLMRLCGYYCAEGSVDRDAVYFNFGKHEKEYIDDTRELLFEIFNIKAKVKSSSLSALPVYISSTILSKLFGKLFGNHAHEKKLPDWFIFLPNKLLKEFVKGFWRGDGNISNNGFEFNTTSKVLSNQLRMILMRLSIIPSLNVREVNGKKERFSSDGRKFSYKNNIFRISVTGNSIAKLSRILDVEHSFIHRRSKTFNRGKITKNFLWVPVTFVAKENYDGKVFNLKTESETYTLNGFAVHNCTADVGWITGHTYACYGPLLVGASSLIYEGSPDFPDFGRWWKIIDENKVSVFYTAPTAIRMFIKAGDNWISKNLSSLKILGTVGEPIDEESWMWYFNKIGKSRCPLIDTWWQTETGGTLINSLPGIGPFVPTVSGRSFPGTRHEIVDDNGKKVKKGESGNLVQLSPFAPGMLHGVYNNHEKYVETYWKRFKKKYDTSDGAYETNGLIRITGRTDDVMKVAGHRLATAELENAIDKNHLVGESAVVPIPDAIKGQVPVAFVVLKQKSENFEELEKEIKKHVDKKIGPTARPAKIYFVDDLPKTRSGKIMRRILKNLLAGEEPQGLMTLLNPECVEKIKKMISGK